MLISSVLGVINRLPHYPADIFREFPQVVPRRCYPSAGIYSSTEATLRHDRLMMTIDEGEPGFNEQFVRLDLVKAGDWAVLYLDRETGDLWDIT
jgi:hypothetical protein